MPLLTSRRRFVMLSAQTILLGSLFAMPLHSWAQKRTPPVPKTPVFAEDLRYVPGEVLVGVASSASVAPFAPTVRTQAAGNTAFSLAAQRIEGLGVGHVVAQTPQIGLLRLRIDSGETVEAAIARLKASGQVSYAEPNYVRHAFSTPSDTNFLSRQWGPQKISADKAWEIWRPQTQTVIAIIDTGIALNHPDLTNKLFRDGNGNVIGRNYIPDGAGVVDPAKFADDHGHGTHCAGIAAAQINNGVGIAGVAGWNGGANESDVISTKLMPLKVLNAGGSGDDAGVTEAIIWAADHGAKIMSMSLGGADPSDSLTNAVAYAKTKGCVSVAAAGNGNTSEYSYPGATPGVLCVGSTGQSDVLSGFSNYGPWVTVAAPGEGVYSTYFNGDGYAYLSGTSMSTPHVAGELALIASQNPDLSSDRLFDMVQNNTDPVASSGAKTIAGGRVNAYKAMLGSTLSAPTAMTATAKSRSLVALQWTNNAASADNFMVEMAVNGGAFSPLGTSGNVTSTTVSGLLRSTTYLFRLRAMAGGATGTYSEPVSVKTKAF